MKPEVPQMKRSRGRPRTQPLPQSTCPSSPPSSKPSEPENVSHDHDGYFWKPPLPALEFVSNPATPEDTIRSLEGKIKRLEENNAFLKNQVACVSKLFCKEQLELLSGTISKVRQWPEYVIQQSIHMYFYCGTKGYNLLRDMGYPLPAIETIVQRLAKFQYLPGTLQENFQLLEHTAKSFVKEDMIATLIQDEMSIQPRIEYNATTKAISGYVTIPANKNESEYDQVASKVLCFLLAGVNKRWKILVSYVFTGSSYQVPPVIDLLHGIFRRANQIGITILGLPSDLGFRNV